MVGIFLRQKAAQEKLTIVGDGSQRRDFAYIGDVVDANIAAMETNNKDCWGEVFNIGTGKNYSVLEIAKLIGHEYTFIPPRLGEAETTLADITKAKELLNYSPLGDLKDWIEKQ